MLTLTDVLEALTRTRPDLPRVVLTEAAVDSRQVIPGGLFVAMPGERVDGHDFIQDAFARGASAALVQREVDPSLPVIDLRSDLPALPGSYEAPVCLRVDNTLAALQQIARFWRRKLDVRVIGITGSVGKSTTKELIAGVLGMRYRTLRNPGNLNNEIGLPLTLLQLGPGYQRAVLEMGFYVPGEIALLCDIAGPQIGVLTNIGTVHAERAGSQEAIARGKSELVQALPAGPQGSAVLNFDDPWVRGMADKTRADVLYYGHTADADLWVENIQGLGLEGIRFDLHYRGGTRTIHAPLIGRHSADTVMRAAAVGLLEGLTWDEIEAGLQFGHTQLRLVATRAASGALLLDDSYNASPESMLSALNLLSELPGRKVAVLGDMLELGPYERQGHEMVGQRAAGVADVLLTIGERAHIIAASARQAGMPAAAVIENDRLDAVIDWLRGSLTGGDAVLIKGSHGLRMDRITIALEGSA